MNSKPACTTTSQCYRERMSKGIDEETGLVDVYELCPERGDSIMIVNCGDHYEVHHRHWGTVPPFLTDEDIEMLKRGQITWN